VTIEDINNAEKIFGKDVSTLKGRSTQKKPIPVIDESIEIPKEIIDNNQKNTLYMDIMFINQQAMLTAVDKVIKYRSLIPFG